MKGKKIRLTVFSYNQESNSFREYDAYFDADYLRSMNMRPYDAPKGQKIHVKGTPSIDNKCVLTTGGVSTSPGHDMVQVAFSMDKTKEYLIGQGVWDI